MVLVFEMLVVVFMVVVDFPRHRAIGHGDFGLRGSRRRLAAEVEASETKGARHDSGKDL